MSSSPNLLAQLSAKNTVLHVERKGANKQYTKTVEQARVASNAEDLYTFRTAQRSAIRSSSLMRVGKLAEAEQQALMALRYARAVEVEGGPGMSLEALRCLVNLYTTQARFGDAEPYARELVERMTQTLGLKHPMTLEPMQSLATILATKGNFRQAGSILQNVYDACTEGGNTSWGDSCWALTTDTSDASSESNG